MATEIELRRHTDSDGDVLTQEGSAGGTGGRRGPSRRLSAARVERSAARHPDTCLLWVRARQRVPGGALVEGRRRQAYQQAGSGELGALRAADPGPVEEDSAVLGAALRRVLDRLPDGGRVPVVGLSPTNEAAVLGLTRTLVEPMARGPESLSSPTERHAGRALQ